MAIKNIQLRPPGNNHDDIDHPETNSGQVIMGDGKTLEQFKTDVNTAHNEHLADIASGEKHGLRIVEGTLEYFDGVGWKPVSAGTGELIPSNPINNLTARPTATGVYLTWNNPIDSNFKSIRLVRKTGSYPTSITDGTIVYEGGLEYFDDTPLNVGTLYYYRAFTLGQNNLWNTQEVYAKETAGTMIYGYEIDESNSNPATSVTYTDSAIGKNPASGDWDNVYPFNAIRPVLFKNGQVVVELNKNDYTKDIYGNPVDIVSGDDGDVMIEFPLIYWKMSKSGSVVSAKIATTDVDSSFKPLAHKVGTQIRNKIYIGAYHGSELNGKLRSLSGKAPKANITIGAMRTLAQANGAGYQQLTYYQVLMLQHLFLLRFKNKDSQTALGRGFVDGNSAAINTGGTDKKGMYYGETTGKLQLKCFGLEDMWGNVRDWVDGFFSNATRNMLISDQSVFNDDGSGYTDFGQGAGANVSGYMTAIQGGTETGFVTKVGGGSETTHYCDYGHLSASRLPYFGGSWSAAGSAGAFTLHVDSSAAAAYAGIGGRLVFLG